MNFGKYIFGLCIVNLLFTTLTFAQNQDDCGTEMSFQEMKKIRSIFQAAKENNQKINADSTVPVKFHIIGYANMSGAIDSASLFNELAITNNYFQYAGIQFAHCGSIQYLYDDTYADFQKTIDETVCVANDEFNVLNIYLVPKLTSTSGSICGYAYTSGVTKNRIIIQNSCAVNGSTMPHEIGHFFSLAHTHSTSSGVEYVNGSNCATTGDELCDTPADPTLSTTNVNNSCDYTGTTLDPTSTPYQPNTHNIMSYSRKSCRDVFSVQQYQRIHDYWVAYRNYLGCGSAPAIVYQQVVAPIEIFPNPASEKMTITGASIIEQIKLYDYAGRLMLQSRPRTNSYDVDLLYIASGIYLLSVQVNGQEIREKLIKR